MAPPVGRQVECGRPGARENDLGIRRVEGHLPDVELIHRRIQPLEMLAAVLAAVNAVVCPGEHRSRFFWMHRKSENAAFGPEPRPHLPPAFAAIGAHPCAGTDCADANPELVGHDCFLPKFAYAVCHPVWEMSITTPSGPAHFISKLRCPPSASSMSSPGCASSRFPCALSSFAAASSRFSTSKPK